MKKIRNIIIILLIIILSNFNIKVYADISEAPQGGSSGSGGVSEILNQSDDFIQKGQEALKEDKNKDGKPDEVINTTKLKNLNSKIFNILLSLGVVMAVIIGGILGIQLMWGSIEQQVKAKEMLFPYGLGCIVVFGAFGIWKICIEIFSTL